MCVRSSAVRQYAKKGENVNRQQMQKDLRARVEQEQKDLDAGLIVQKTHTCGGDLAQVDHCRGCAEDEIKRLDRLREHLLHEDKTQI